jgi:hypothetical protein
MSRPTGTTDDLLEVEILRYSDSLKSAWDAFIPITKNRSFLFLRDYMDYHQDRFHDHSLLFLVNGALKACLPANVAGRILHSHQGLTFGGLLMHRDVRLNDVLAIVAALRRRLASDGLEALIYRPMPHPYHEVPAGEDIVALHANHVAVVDVRATLCVRAGEIERLSQNRRRDLRSDRQGETVIRRSDDFPTFMRQCTAYLARRHGGRPVHSEQEIALLASRFPDNIKLFVIEGAAGMLAGVILYRHGNCTKAQYIAMGTGPVRNGALTKLLVHILSAVLPAGSWFDFGHSYDPADRLNHGVHRFKESLGARTVPVTTYRLAAAQCEV